MRLCCTPSSLRDEIHLGKDHTKIAPGIGLDTWRKPIEAVISLDVELETHIGRRFLDLQRNLT